MFLILYNEETQARQYSCPSPAQSKRSVDKTERKLLPLISPVLSQWCTARRTVLVSLQNLSLLMECFPGLTETLMGTGPLGPILVKIITNTQTKNLQPGLELEISFLALSV